ncbi:MAG TPA: hypothetical protein VGS27_31310 [Candidatus Sulfotelmatobacter sp.]|nr:hypothetical protein [Candidatus Sulfotelmatobacter sp.]
MKTLCLIAALFALTLAAAGQGKTLTNDPLTDLPLIPATDSGKRIANLSIIYNEPIHMPGAQICKSKFQGDFYSLFNIKVDAAVAWYSSHLSGFKKVSGYESGRSQTAFYNLDRTLLVIVTGNPGASGENTGAYSVAYQRYQPGLSEKTVASLTQGKIVCQ